MSDKDNLICPSCGASYHKDLTECPYCGAASYYGQEKRYMQGLAGLRQRMSDLADIKPQFVIKEAVRVLLLIIVVAAIIISAIMLIKTYDYHSEVRHFNEIREELINEIR